MADKQQKQISQGPKKSAITAVICVVIATAMIIGAGKLIAPIAIGLIYPPTATPAIPPRPVGSIHDLTDPTAAVRQKAVRALAKHNFGNPNVFRELAKTLCEDTDPGVQLEAATAFATGQPLPEFLPTLLNGLTINDSKIRRQLLLAIEMLDVSADDDITALKQIVDNDSETESNRKLAAEIVSRIPPAN